jgi:soluble lytic murein transglycosylase-like protein
MKMNKNDLVIISALVLSFFAGRYTAPEKVKIVEVMVKEEKKEDPPCIQMYTCIEKYSRMYNIPRKYAYGIAYKETTYLGPDHIDYNPYRVSSAGALGPMQIMVGTAEMAHGKRPTKNKLKTDIEYNVETSMKILRQLKDRHKNWKKVFGAYNTGRPVVNKYAEQVYAFVPQW